MDGPQSEAKESSPPSPSFYPPLPFCLNWTCGIPSFCDLPSSPKSLLREQFLKKPNFVLLFAKGQSDGKLSSGNGRDSSTRRAIFTPLATGTRIVNCKACCTVQTDPTFFQTNGHGIRSRCWRLRLTQTRKVKMSYLFFFSQNT